MCVTTTFFFIIFLFDSLVEIRNFRFLYCILVGSGSGEWRQTTTFIVSRVTFTVNIHGILELKFVYFDKKKMIFNMILTICLDIHV